jgi:hypothetical protein
MFRLRTEGYIPVDSEFRLLYFLRVHDQQALGLELKFDSARLFVHWSFEMPLELLFCKGY